MRLAAASLRSFSRPIIVWAWLCVTTFVSALMAATATAMSGDRPSASWKSLTTLSPPATTLNLGAPVPADAADCVAQAGGSYLGWAGLPQQSGHVCREAVGAAALAGLLQPAAASCSTPLRRPAVVWVAETCLHTQDWLRSWLHPTQKPLAHVGAVYLLHPLDRLSRQKCSAASSRTGDDCSWTPYPRA